jgi:AcrR family transcriptional regulator
MLAPSGPVVKSECSFYYGPMPRVSQEHLDARRRQILGAARRRFARDGFHATSMQDILAESGLSAGAVYRYFPGKADIIEAIAAEATGLIAGLVLDRDWASAPPPLATLLAEVIEAVESLDEEQNVTGLAVQVWGEALRSPTMSAVIAGGMSRIEAALAPAIDAYQRRGDIDPAVPAGDVIRSFVAVMQGFIVQHNLGGIGAEAFRRGVAALAEGLRADAAAAGDATTAPASAAQPAATC